MGDPNDYIRLFHLSDDEMLEASKTKKGFFADDKPTFIGFDPDFNDPFEANWLAAIVLAESMQTASTTMSVQAQLTAIVENVMELCRHKFQDAKYFIKKVFGTNPAVKNEFGYNNYLKARKKQSLMILFMQQFHLVAEKYKVELLAVNYTQPMIDEILTLKNDLDTANSNQEKYKGERGTITQIRVVALNDVWSYVVKVCEAGQIIFHDNPAKFHEYELPRSSTPHPVRTIIFATDQTNPDKSLYQVKAAADGKKIDADFGDGSPEVQYTVNMIDHTLIGHTFINAGNFQTKLTGEIPAFDELIAPDNKIMASNIPEGIKLRKIDMGNNPQGSFALPLSCDTIEEALFFNNKFDQQSTNAFLIQVNGYGTYNGHIDLSGPDMAAPSGQGLAAKNQLIARGWTVITN